MSTFADRFAVDYWLESPAKWLAWALDSMKESNLVDAHYNLDQFWNEIEPWKSTRLRPKEWGDLMTLDAQANWALGNWYDASASLLMQAAAEADQVSGALQYILPPVGVGQWIAERMGWNPARVGMREALEELASLRAEAYKNAQDLAQQAKSALESVGAPLGQAGNTVTVTGNAVASLPSREQFEQGRASDTFKPLLDQLPSALKAPFGIAWYWWAAGAAALVLLPILLAPSPRITIARD